MTKKHTQNDKPGGQRQAGAGRGEHYRKGKPPFHKSPEQDDDAKQYGRETEHHEHDIPAHINPFNGEPRRKSLDPRSA